MTTHSELPHPGLVAPGTTLRARYLRLLVPIGRALFAAIFVTAGAGHFSGSAIGYASAHGVPFANVLVPLSGLLALVGGLSVLIGLKARYGATLLVLFLVPVTLAMHDFWSVSDPAMAEMQRIMFMKNLSMLGGALLLVYFGAGPLSIDARRSGRLSKRTASP